MDFAALSHALQGWQQYHWWVNGRRWEGQSKTVSCSSLRLESLLFVSPCASNSSKQEDCGSLVDLWLSSGWCDPGLGCLYANLPFTSTLKPVCVRAIRNGYYEHEEPCKLHAVWMFRAWADAEMLSHVPLGEDVLVCFTCSGMAPHQNRPVCDCADRRLRMVFVQAQL